MWVVYFWSNIARNLTHLSAVEEVSIGLSNILRDMTQLSTVEKHGYCEHLWELSDQNELLLHCRVSQCESYQELQGCWYFLLIWLVPHPIPSSILQYTLTRHIHKVRKVMFTISLLFHSCQKYISFSPLTYLTHLLTQITALCTCAIIIMHN